MRNALQVRGAFLFFNGGMQSGHDGKEADAEAPKGECEVEFPTLPGDEHCEPDHARQESAYHFGLAAAACEAELQQGANEYQMFPVSPGNESRATLTLGVARGRSSYRLPGKSHEGANRIAIGRACGVVCLGQSNK